jgi:hypothetical protein
MKKNNDSLLRTIIHMYDEKTRIFYSSKKPRVNGIFRNLDMMNEGIKRLNEHMKFLGNTTKKIEKLKEAEKIRIATTAGFGFEVREPTLQLIEIVTYEKWREIEKRRYRFHIQQPKPIEDRLKDYKRKKRRARKEELKASQQKPLAKRLEEYKASKIAKSQITGAENE